MPVDAKRKGLVRERTYSAYRRKDPNEAVTTATRRNVAASLPAATDRQTDSATPWFEHVDKPSALMLLRLRLGAGPAQLSPATCSARNPSNSHWSGVSSYPENANERKFRLDLKPRNQRRRVQTLLLLRISRITALPIAPPANPPSAIILPGSKALLIEPRPAHVQRAPPALIYFPLDKHDTRALGVPNEALADVRARVLPRRDVRPRIGNFAQERTERLDECRV